MKFYWGKGMENRREEKEMERQTGREGERKRETEARKFLFVPS